MPLHLLGKKSWNVYNTANIDRVRHDEAKAREKEEAEEQRTQQEDAARRTGILRGEGFKGVSSTDLSTEDREAGTYDRDYQVSRKRRRLHGEDDTDRDIRWARQDAETSRKARVTLSRRDTDVPIHDQDGHIQLVPVPDVKEASKIEKNAEVETEKARKQRQDEDHYTMRFSNAAGFKNNMQAPWYAERSTSTVAAMPAKDVWGNEDPRRRDREQKRVVSNDPLAFMQQAQRQLKQSEHDRERWRTERTAELRDLKRDQQKRRHRTHDEIEPLDLDGLKQEPRKHRRHHHRRRSRSRH
ncbi:hypothetical protein AMS68_005333 [Peltaster fructicola]|uniref:CBF1-interacting co-repressor CIR N-terminal domain-containing protein n=1 Tax=Peltaster fructicola TaxID=286661 RepID=A0A6H0XYR0_9PEZI|nr:hypothetical protein AMS68_005333 [Peltaster fructicola]